MADPLSTGAGVIAFIQLADSVIRACKECIESIKDAPKDMQMILGEVTSLKAIIESFSAADSHANTTRLVPSLFEAGGPVEACQRCLSTLRGLLPPDIPEPSKGKLRRITVSELAWPFGSQPKARKLLAEISLHKSTLLLAITGDMIHDIKDIRAGVQRLELTITDNQRREITRWLESVNPSLLHNAAFKKHEEHTSAWLLKSPEWNHWRGQESTQNFLWIHGIPGSGKTVLASFIIEHLKAICGSDPELGCAYYYCHYSHNQDEGTSFLKWTIAQLCRHAKWIPAQLKELYDHGCEPSIPELENALEAVLERFKMIYIVIDAVDESTPRSEMLAVIATIAVDIRFRKIKVLVTSREYFDIERKFSGISEAISMSNLLVEEDIKLFVHSRLLAGPLKRRFRHLLNRIECVLVAKAQGMYCDPVPE
ncbi:vegetative incompatibility protein het-e-1 [Leptodontidium sp. MPI-SDFR-AT-0119]|nr:vegetative incompatibility protein het-e-1 [Leptodontidium sp. MPI-SDFR-AT-0119]